MKQKITNYTVIIEKEKRTGTNIDCYSAYVPAFGIATEADTLSQVKREIKELMQFHIETLIEEGSNIPIESRKSLVIKIPTLIPSKSRLAA